MGFWTPERKRFHALFPAIGNKKLGTAIKFYHMALSHGFTPVGAQYLVSHAWLESEFDPHSQPDHGIHQVGANVDNLSPAGQFQWYMDHMRPEMRTMINNADSVMGAFTAVRRFPGWETGSAHRWIAAENAGAFPVQPVGQTASPFPMETPMSSPSASPTPEPTASPIQSATPGEMPSATASDIAPPFSESPSPTPSSDILQGEPTSPVEFGYAPGEMPDQIYSPTPLESFSPSSYDTGYADSLMQPSTDFSVPTSGITQPDAMTFGQYQSPSEFIPQGVTFQGSQFDTSQAPYASAPPAAPPEISMSPFDPNEIMNVANSQMFGPGEIPNNQSQYSYDLGFQGSPNDQSILGPDFQTVNALGFDPSQSQASPDFSPDAVASGIPLPGATFDLGSFGGGNLGTIGGDIAWHEAQPMFGGQTLAQVARFSPSLLPGLANMGGRFSGWQSTVIGPGGGRFLSSQ